MEFQDIIGAVTNYGACFVVMVYFLVRDWKYQNTVIEMMGKLSETMGHVDDFLRSIGKET